MSDVWDSGEERRAKNHVVVDELPIASKKGMRRIQLELAFMVSVLLAIFGLLLKNSVDIGKLEAMTAGHKTAADNRAEVLTGAVSNLTESDDRIMLQLERILTRQDQNGNRLNHIEAQVDRHIEAQ